MEKLIKNIEKCVKLPKVAKKELLNCALMHHFQKGDAIVKIGENCTQLFFIDTGIVRSYLNKNDREITTWLYYPEEFVSVWDSFLNQQMSNEIIEAVTCLTLISIEYEQLQRLFKKHPALEVWGRKLMEGYTLYFNRFNQKLRFATAQEKYDYFLESFPQEQKIKLGYVASFLGMSQETLSRLRRDAKVY